MSLVKYPPVCHVTNHFLLVYRAGTKYTVNVFGMFEGGESMPLAGQEKTTLVDLPTPPPYEATGKVIFQTTNIQHLKKCQQRKNIKHVLC